FNYYPSAQLNIDFGASTIYYSNKPGSLEPYSDKSLIVADILPQEQALESAIFAEQRYDITEAITLNAGLRYSFFNYLGPANVNIYADGLDKTDANIINVESYGNKKTIKTYHSPE